MSRYIRKGRANQYNKAKGYRPASLVFMVFFVIMALLGLLMALAGAA